MNVLEIQDLHKSFGKHSVLRGLNMAVPEHSVYGFVGQNGAGKTTTMKIVLGLLAANRGQVQVCSEKVRYGQTPTNRHIGYLPDVPEFYNYLRPTEYLALCGEITGMSRKQTRKRSAEMLELVGLTAEKRRIGGFSRGMKQRLGIAQALLNNPQLLICDEPTSALDPIGRKEILDILQAIKGKTTVVFSTHVLSDVERICDRVAVLADGHLVLDGTLAEIKAGRRQNGLVIEFTNAEDLARFQSALAQRQPAIQLNADHYTLTVNITDAATRGDWLLELLGRMHIVPERLEMLEPSLESLFAEAVRS